MPTAVADPALFTGDNAGFRIAILAKNSSINTTDKSGAVDGSLRTRNVFYAGQLNSNDAYVLFKGTESQVNQYLANTKLCPIDLTQKEEVYVDTQQLDLSLLNSQGLRNSESTSGYAAPTPTGTSATISGHVDWVSGLKGTSRSKFSFNANLVTAKIIGRLQTKTTAGVLVDYTAPYITIQCYDRGNNALAVSRSGAVFQAPVRIFPGANYSARCNFTDTSVANSGNSVLNTQYLYNEIGVNVPGKSVSKEVNFGNILLLTRSGQYCENNTGNCWTDQKFKSGPLNVSVVNGITGLPLSGVAVKLQKYYYPQGDTVSSAATKNGSAKYDNIFYGAYTIYASAPNMKSTSHWVAHQSADTKVTIVMLPAETTSDYTVMYQSGQGVTSAYDLNLEVKNFSGTKTCTASPTSKYCAYARYLDEPTRVSKYAQVIDVKRFAVATYMAYISPATITPATCSAADLLNQTDDRYKWMSL